jgi:alpha/beta superfamily hydrolase
MAVRRDKSPHRFDGTSVPDGSGQLEVTGVAPLSPPAALIAQTDNAPVTWRYYEATMDLGLKCLRIAYNGNGIVSGGLYHLRPAENLEMRQMIESRISGQVLVAVTSQTT